MMDLPCVQWQDHVAQKWAGLDPELRESFTSLLQTDDMFKCSLTMITADDLDFVDSISAGRSVQKDAEKAAKCRERGNSSFKDGDYTAAALHYTQGVCSAPLSSDQLSLCFANRSAALSHLQRYQESLDDISKALKSGYPSHLLHKLEERRKQCLKHLSVSQKAKVEHHNPASKNHGPERLGCVCPQAAFAFSPEKGRHLVAAERITAGEVILTDRPYSCVLIPGMGGRRGTAAQHDTESGAFGMEHRRCHRCLSETLSPVPCDGCSYSLYCSTSCQQDAWEEHHRWECPLGADLVVMGVMSQLALRVALKAGLKSIKTARDPIGDEHTKSKRSCTNSESNHSYSCRTPYYSDSYRSLFHLLHHLDRHSPRLRFLYAVTIATLYLKLSKAGPPLSAWGLSGPSGEKSQPDMEDGVTDRSSELWLLGSAALRHILQLRCNAQAIILLQDTGSTDSLVQSNREMRIATAIFPTLSLLNHSCCPNTSLVFMPGTVSDPSASDRSADFSHCAAEDGSEPYGVTVTVRAAKVIPPGQEILHCYGPHSSRMVTRERQHLLQEQYFFLCQCEACTLQQEEEEEEEEEGADGRRHWSASSRQESGLLCRTCEGSLKKCCESTGTGFLCSQSGCGHRVSSSEVSRGLQQVRLDLEKAVDLVERERPGEALKILRGTKGQSGLILAETHPLQGELADATARAYAAMGDWNNAASHLQRSAAAIGSQYGEDSIELGHQLFKLAQLHFNGGSRDQALAVIPRVRRLLRLHCGPHCRELQELQAMDDCLRG